MAEYGVLPTGVNIKRLDVILDELHTDLSEGWDVNTRLNPKSFLNVQLTAFGDKVAELWEIGEQIYNAMYPFSAEGRSLDNAAQYGGIAREEARPTIYPIHCECVDGTVIPRGTMIRTNTNPAIPFRINAESVVHRGAFNRASVRVAVVQASYLYTVALNGALYNYASGGQPTEEEILTGLAAAIMDAGFTVTVGGALLIIAAVDPQSSNQLILSSNLTTANVTGIVNFESMAFGEIITPNNTITEIVTAFPGLISVNNMIPYIAGRLLQNDSELRQSYADKIFARSNRMIDSIKSAILLNVQGVTAVAGYQNDTNVVDAYERWPHCVEMIVDGGSDYEIALQIWDKKTDGIQTFGDVEVTIPGDEGETVTMRFNRPDYVFVWFQLTIMLNNTEPLPPNYAEAIAEIIVAEMARVEPGTPIVPQRLIEGRIYGAVPGIAYIETRTFHTEDAQEQPDAYTVGMVPITPRQRAVTDAARIEVILGGP